MNISMEMGRGQEGRGPANHVNKRIDKRTKC